MCVWAAIYTTKLLQFRKTHLVFFCRRGVDGLQVDHPPVYSLGVRPALLQRLTQLGDLGIFALQTLTGVALKALEAPAEKREVSIKVAYYIFTQLVSIRLTISSFQASSWSPPSLFART